MRVQEEKGFALVLTLVITALLVAISAEFIHGVYVETSLHRNYLDTQQASLLAEGGVSGGVALLQRMKASGGDKALLEIIAKPLDLADEKGSVSVTIEEEDGKLNLNAVTLPTGIDNEFYARVERRLFKQLGLPATLHDTLADWVDGDDEPRLDGAESTWYRALPVPYEAKNSLLDTYGELGLVKGFTPAILEVLRPCATVHSPGGTIDINTAPQQVLQALDDDMTERLSREIIDRRRIRPFTNIGQLSEIPGMDRIVGRLTGWVGVKGSTYRLVARAKVGDAVRLIEAVVNIDGPQLKYLYWREY